MRVTTSTPIVRIDAGKTGDVNLVIRNTSPIIDKMVVEILGLPGVTVSTTPAALALFPDTDGKMVVSFSLPKSFPAGSHPFVVHVFSTLQPAQQAYAEVELVIEEARELSVRVEPTRVRARRSATFQATYRNDGNTPLDVQLSAIDAERKVNAKVPGEPTMLPPGATATRTLSVKGPRMLTGSETDRHITVTAMSGETRGDTDVVLRQRPTIARGVITAAVLASIVLLWAGAFLAGLTKAFGSDPLTKAAPASYFITKDASRGLAADITSDENLPKTGPLPAGVGSTVTGFVRATNTDAGVGRIVVQALRLSSAGPVLFTSAATEADGSYSLVGLLPGSDYVLKFTATGYSDVYYPAAADESDATPLEFDAQELRTDVDAVVTGLPASITGSVDTGDSLNRVPVTIVASSLLGPTPGTPIATVVTDASGNFTMPDLPSPDTYQLGFTATGYEPSTVTEDVGGGEARQVPTVAVLAQNGAISGEVCAGKTGPISCAGVPGLGGVTVSTVVDGKTVTTATPTQGGVGHYTLAGLPTPGTYVVSYTLPGFGAQTQVVDLGPQEQKSVDAGLASGAGSLRGTVVNAAGPLGAVSVTVGGAATPLSTTTLTGGGSPGGYALSGLKVPGSYTVTYALAGYTSVTLPVTLTTDNPAPMIPTVTLSPSTGTVTGTVTSSGSGQALGGVTVQLTDGSTIRSTKTVDNGTYSFTTVPAAPGTDGTAYTLTISDPGYSTQVLVIRVHQNQSVTQDVPLVTGS